MKKLFLILLLISFSFSSLVWEFGTDGEISKKPVIYRNSVVVASDDGTIYALNPSTGSKTWEVRIGEYPNEIFIFDNGLITSTRMGKVIRIGEGGRIAWTADLTSQLYNVSRIYGASANAKNIFISANNGIYAISKTGEVNIVTSFANATVTPPASGADFVIYGKGSELIRLSETGTVMFRAHIDDGSFWLSQPVIHENNVYVGSLDDKIHAYRVSNGLKLWEVKSRNWVVSTPIADGNTVYVGSNDGNLYAIDASSGSIRWKTATQLAIKTTPESGYMGGEEVVFVGGSDRNIYAISKNDGSIVWKGPVAGSAGSPLYHQGTVILGAADNNVYAFSTARACSITNPREGDLLGKKEVVITGKLVSESGGVTVLVSINGGNWIEANISESDWQLIVDPSMAFAPGLNSISCRTIDAGGEESGPKFTTVAINNDPNKPLSELKVKLSTSSIIEGTEFSMFVNDGDDGSSVERFTYIINGEERTGSKIINLTLAEPGQYSLIVRKMGFRDYSTTLNVNQSGISPLILGGAVLAIIIIVWQVWTKVLSKRFKKRK
ncbi:PQQ-binding-like beta-propeller repeat protein [Candidatus Micrarchaeota archaeon]|nr:PQQ-binding-like beta-propeller repeat protein [Candidatus Micrarchaeota archaeon]